MELAFLRRPPIRFLARASHQHGPVAFAQAIRFQKRLDGIFVIDHRECARPVGAPQAAFHSPRVEYFRERVPDVVKGIRFFRQRAGAADFDHDVLAFGEFDDFRQIGPRLGSA